MYARIKNWIVCNKLVRVIARMKATEKKNVVSVWLNYYYGIKYFPQIQYLFHFLTSAIFATLQGDVTGQSKFPDLEPCPPTATNSTRQACYRVSMRLLLNGIQI